MQAQSDTVERSHDFFDRERFMVVSIPSPALLGLDGITRALAHRVSPASKTPEKSRDYFEFTVSLERLEGQFELSIPVEALAQAIGRSDKIMKLTFVATVGFRKVGSSRWTRKPGLLCIDLNMMRLVFES